MYSNLYFFSVFNSFPSPLILLVIVQRRLLKLRLALRDGWGQMRAIILLSPYPQFLHLSRGNGAYSLSLPPQQDQRDILHYCGALE